MLNQLPDVARTVINRYRMHHKGLYTLVPDTLCPETGDFVARNGNFVSGNRILSCCFWQQSHLFPDTKYPVSGTSACGQAITHLGNNDDKRHGSEKLTFNRCVVIAEVEFMNATLCWHVLNRHRTVLVRLECRLRASCGRHHGELVARAATSLSSSLIPIAHRYTHSQSINQLINWDVYVNSAEIQRVN